VRLRVRREERGIKRKREKEREGERMYKKMTWGRAREEAALLIRCLKILFVEKVG